MVIQKFKKQLNDITSRLNDIRFVGQFLFLIIVFLVCWSGVKAIQANYELQKQITSIQQQNDLQSLQNDNLKLTNQYYNSNQYLELSARQNFGLAEPGEKELIVPAGVAWNYTINLPSTNTSSSAIVVKSQFQKNTQSWIDFFLHRQD